MLTVAKWHRHRARTHVINVPATGTVAGVSRKIIFGFNKLHRKPSVKRWQEYIFAL